MKGGARNRSGPPPDPNALNRDRKTDGEWTILPAAGRAGAPPKWPLAKVDSAERAMWKEMWSTPQAVEWERTGQVRMVALYVRRVLEAEERGSPVNLSTLVRQMADGLGLTTPGMRSNRWVIGPEEKQPVAAPRRSSSRARLTVVEAANAVERTADSG